MKSRRTWLRLAVAQGLLLGLLLVSGVVRAQVATTTVQGTVYRADGTPAQGTMLVSWPAFVTAANQAVAAGSLTVALGSDGFATMQLAPNVGASPSGTYYTVVYHLGDGAANREFWTVPAAATATIASVRAELEPSMMAVQSVSKSYVDNLVATIAPTVGNFLPLAGGSLAGPLTLSADPTAASQASTKHYVDTAVATAVPLSGGIVTGTLGMANEIAKLPRVDVRATDFAGGADPTGVKDSTAAIQAAIAFALTQAPSNQNNYPAVYVPPGHYKISGTLRMPGQMQLIGDGRSGAILQQTDPTASLITVYNSINCSTYSCYGGVENLTLEGTGKATAGTLLELNTGWFTLRNLHFFNNGGRGLQMNGGSERVATYDLSFYQVRWPLIMGGDSNEDYFYNTHIIEAGQTADNGNGQPIVGHWCYSINCTNGQFAADGTTSSPTTILPDPRGQIHIDKAVNVSFIGGSVKSTWMLSGVKIWSGTVVRFQNFYHEEEYFGGSTVLSTNRAYIVGGKGEQTFLTGALSGTGLTATVNDPSWMPQGFGTAADATVNDGNYHPYVILPQDYNRASTAASAYVSGLNQNQYEIVNAEGFTPDGIMHLQPGGRNNGGSAPAGTVWPAGSVVEEYSSGGASLEMDGVHINQVQGPQTAGGWQAACNQTTSNACGEVIVGYMPDVQSPTSTPATNKVGFYAPLNDPNDPVNGATAYLKMRHMEMFSNGSNPAVGMVVAEHRAAIEIEGPIDPERVESQAAVQYQTSGQQVSIAGATGGSVVFAPTYPNGVAAVNLSMADGEILWDSARGVYHKHTSVFGPYQQYGSYMNGLQYQNLYCLFDTPVTDGGHVANRFCTGGGPGNASGSGTQYGPGIEYDSYNGSSWVNMFKVTGQGTGSMTASVPAQFGSSLAVTGAVTAGAAVSVTGNLSAGGNTSVTGTGTFTGLLTASGSARVGGALTASKVNSTVTVDGLTYTTLNQAWTAAIAAATSTGRNQTIWLGPGAYPVTATMTEPTNGACVSVIGSAGTTVGSDITSTATTLTVPAALNGDVFLLGNTTLTEGCTFKDLNVLAGKNATHGFEFQWARGLLLDTVAVNDTTAEGILLGETSGTHQMNSLLSNITVSYSSAAFTPATRPAYGVHLQKTAIDSVMHTVLVRNALTAAVWNEGTGNTGWAIHGFGYPYTCTTAPCSNTATASTAANASYATNYVVYDTGGAGSTWTDTYADSPAVSAFYVGANGVEIHGGHVQWPELTSFPAANFASVAATVTNGLMIGDVSCLGMSSSVNWINYASASGVPPVNASVHHLTGCGNYYQSLEPATTTGFSGGGASNNAPGNGAVSAVWAAPKAAAATYSAYSAQEYTGYLGDLFDGHIAGQMPFFNITYQGTIKSAGGLALSTVLNTATTLTLTTANKNVIANAASGAQTITLPSCYTAMADKASPTGLELTVVKSDTSTNAVTLATVSAQLIDYQGATATTLVIGSAGKRSLVCGPDSNWYAY
ncbi:glycosyl hydrolase family 28-related protein [Acidipila sp. EB88]|uniref:glycosyl hydrolase family 28-related protein n=1 Tax=Acidipila sp. EB88 TaxID=2305226 RepID=UPI000F5E982C|nr:glycosyl hydrolase family 28-related protein [Acidipila sp. EB88]RRA48231.1 hypothetical protein D1Y84_07955 [Acidipila sp. EB88]